jgi:hypothetical protein
MSLNHSLTDTFTVGLDLGQSFDPSAVAVVRRVEQSNGRSLYQVGHLERLPLQMPYPQQVSYVTGLMSRLRSPNVELVLDVTGVGKAVADLFAVTSLATINVTITAGDATTSEGLDFHVPKLSLVSRLQALLHNGQLKIHKDLADAPELVSELQNFRAQVSESGYWKFGARSGKHDDLVLAVAIALWRSHGDTCFSGWNVFEFYRKEYGGGGTDKELTALPAPLPPIEPPPLEQQFGYSVGAPKPQIQTVTLKPPANVSQLSGLSGRSYVPDKHGLFLVTVEDSKPLIAHGWQKAKPVIERWRP